MEAPKLGFWNGEEKCKRERERVKGEQITKV
jgi:hypothetical protein